MSACALPIPPSGLAADLHRPTERSATSSENREQTTGDRPEAASRAHPQRLDQALQHFGDLVILLPPGLPDHLVDVAEIETVADPHPHLVGRAQGHDQEATEVRRLHPLPGKALGDVGADRLARPSHLIASPRCSIGGNSRLLPWTAKDTFYARFNTPRSSKEPAGGSPCLFSVICSLSSELRSFGAWLEPRYIFGAGQLLDQ